MSPYLIFANIFTMRGTTTDEKMCTDKNSSGLSRLHYFKFLLLLVLIFTYANGVDSNFQYRSM